MVVEWEYFAQTKKDKKKKPNTKNKTKQKRIKNCILHVFLKPWSVFRQYILVFSLSSTVMVQTIKSKLS